MKVRTQYPTILAGALFAGLILGAQTAHAGDLEMGTLELSGFGGATARLNGTKLAAGGTFGLAVAKNLMVLGEVGYMPLGSQKFSGFGITSSGSLRAMDFNGTAHYQFLSSGNFNPYVAAGVGMLRFTAKSSASGFGSTASASSSDSSIVANFGGGFRYHLSRNFGIRPEVMVFARNGSFLRYGVGIFYQFGK